MKLGSLAGLPEKKEEIKSEDFRDIVENTSASSFNTCKSQYDSLNISLGDIDEKFENELIEVMENAQKEYKRQCEKGWPNPCIKESRWILRAVYKAISASGDKVIKVTKGS